MRSRAEVRRAGEWVLRAAIIAGLALSLWRAVHEPVAGAERRAATSGALARTLDDATRGARIGSIDLEVDSLPTAVQRGWLAALNAAGVPVRWRGTLPALGVSAERGREPEAPVRVLLTADTGATVALSDSVGPLDTLRTRGGGASLEAADVVGMVQARRGAYSATVALPPAGTPHDVLVLGRASWESKFVLAALTEAGWRVRARLPAAPGIAVTDPALLPVDTGRYDVVIALDSSAADLAPAIARFVSAGGGLVAAGSATSLDALRALMPAQASGRRPGRILLDADSATQADLPLRPLGSVRADAIALERQTGGLAVAVRRAGLARVLAIGYDESWRWRMVGGSSGPAAHRAWWSRTVGLVAPEHTPPRPSASSGDAAPVAALMAALGPPAPAASLALPRHGGDPLPLALLALIAAALLAETASRRFRGAR
jgi:hypothetical protein